ncbi:DASH complex subunit DAD2 like protein [Verticillium longisporum]|uniref:DASH complex subunit DAD2 n=1 Tax=Verticillium longisporum TaxID=100787 RepID=A0A8I3AUX1_VERLO|nr:DASH complex subunit DAD2 like protein [Verticillium longisporum]
MSYHTRSLSTRLTGPGAGVRDGSSSMGGPSPALVARIEEKKAELDNLKQLRDLSAAVASQMEALEQQLSTLSDGTEAIATVIGNWHNVLRAINMASTKIPMPKDDATDDATDDASESAPSLPQTLRSRIKPQERPLERTTTTNIHIGLPRSQRLRSTSCLNGEMLTSRKGTPHCNFTE